MDLTNPFQHRPARLARLPRIMRVYIANAAIGFGIAALFTAFLITSNTANLGHLVTSNNDGVLAAFLLFFFNGIVFSSVQFAIVIMTLDDNDD
ncbi:MAG: hypothetical protein AAF826_13610 [Pseudomonadota bacterium]